MDEVIVYLNKINELRFRARNVEVYDVVDFVGEIKKYCESLKNSITLTDREKQLLEKEFLALIPIEKVYKALKESESNPLFAILGTTVGKGAYDALMSTAQAFFEKTKGEQFG